MRKSLLDEGLRFHSDEDCSWNNQRCPPHSIDLNAPEIVPSSIIVRWRSIMGVRNEYWSGLYDFMSCIYISINCSGGVVCLRASLGL